MGCAASSPTDEPTAAPPAPPPGPSLSPVAEGSEDDIAGRFALLDVERTGFLDRRAVASLVQQLRLAQSPKIKHTEFETVRVHEAEIDHAMKILDTNQDGLVDYEEFSFWWKSSGGSF